jgi:TolB protein
VKFLNENNEIFTLDLESGKETRLSENMKNDDFPVWTNDGRIVFFSDRETLRNEIYIMNADGSNVVNLTNKPANDGQPTISKNGKIVFNSNRTHTMELWIMNLDGTNQIQLTNTGPEAFNSRPQFAPDGQQIIYNSNENDREILRFLNIP